MPPLEVLATNLCLWMVGAALWSGIVYVLFARGAAARRREGWVGYWVLVLAMAFAPPLLLPLVLSVPSPLPALELDGAMAAARVASTWGGDDVGHTTEMTWLGGVALLVLVVYVLALARQAFVFALRWRRLSAMLAQAEPVMLGMATSARVLVIARAVSPFCVGGSRPAIVLSETALAALSADELRWVIAHEACHLRRRDPALFAALDLLTMVWCFSPFVGALAARLRLAAEIACDRAVVAQNPNARRAYAETLVRCLSSEDRTLAPAFGAAGAHSRIRIANILRAGDGKRPALAIICMAFVAVGVSLGAVGAAAAATRIVDLATPHFERVVTGRVTNAFGALQNGRAHEGVDVAAPEGTYVVAPAPARVVYAGDNYQGRRALGMVVVLEHADGWVTVFAHLRRAIVSAGDYIDSGQRIGCVGNSGVSTGPHVHVEMLRYGERADPQALGATP